MLVQRARGSGARQRLGPGVGARGAPPLGAAAAGRPGAGPKGALGITVAAIERAVTTKKARPFQGAERTPKRAGRSFDADRRGWNLVDAGAFLDPLEACRPGRGPGNSVRSPWHSGASDNRRSPSVVGNALYVHNASNDGPSWGWGGSLGADAALDLAADLRAFAPPSCLPAAFPAAQASVSIRASPRSGHRVRPRPSVPAAARSGARCGAAGRARRATAAWARQHAPALPTLWTCGIQQRVVTRAVLGSTSS